MSSCNTLGKGCPKLSQTPQTPKAHKIVNELKFDRDWIYGRITGPNGALVESSILVSPKTFRTNSPGIGSPGPSQGPMYSNSNSPSNGNTGTATTTKRKWSPYTPWTPNPKRTKFDSPKEKPSGGPLDKWIQKSPSLIDVNKDRSSTSTGLFQYAKAPNSETTNNVPALCTSSASQKGTGPSKSNIPGPTRPGFSGPTKVMR